MARNIIDSLMVTLGLDASGFSKGQKEAVAALGRTKKAAGETDKAIRTGHASSTRAVRDTGQVAQRVARGMEASGKQGAEFFGQISGAALKLLGIVTGGAALVEFTRRTMTTAAAQGRLAANLGLSTRALTQWGAAVAQYAGGNAATAESSMGGLLQSFQQFKVTGQPDERMMLLSRYLGIPLGQLRPGNFNGLTGDLAHKLHGMPRPEAYAVGHMLGFDEGTINLLVQGRKALDAHLAAVAKEGTITHNQAVAMQQLQTAMIGVTTASEALGRTLLTDAAPGITRVAHVIQDVLDGDWSKFNKDMAPHGFKTASDAARVPMNFKASPPQKASALAFMNALVGAGVSRAGAAALAGNAMAESSFNLEPKPNPANPHYGLLQWSETRRRQILAGTGIDVAHASAAQQARAAAWELNHTHKKSGRLTNSIKDPRILGQLLDRTYERSGDPPLKIVQRGRYSAEMAVIYDRAHSRSGNAVWTSPPSVHSPWGGPLISPHVDAVLAGLRAVQARHIIHSTTNNHAETHIGAIHVQTRATDGPGTASAIHSSVRRHGLAMQANSGLS